MTAAVTVAVVSWNTRDLLARALRSLEPHAGSGLVDVWVVDNGSSDGSPALVREEFGWATLVEPGENLGFGPAVNLVAERTSGPWIVAANADIAVEPCALEALMAAGESDPRAALLAPRLVLPDGSSQHSVFGFPTVTLSMVFGSGIWRLSPRMADRLCIEGAWDPDRERTVPWAVGAFLLVRRECFDAIGGFDSEQWMYAEDLDLAWRAAAAGFSTRYVPSARVRHEVSAATTQAFGASRRRRHMAASYAWIARRRGVATARMFAASNLFWAAVQAAVRAPAALLLGRGRPQLADLREWIAIHGRALMGR